MNRQVSSSLPDESKIEELLTRIQPVPSERYYRTIKRATWRREIRQPVIKNDLHWRIAFAALAVALLIVFLVSPQGRAWAQGVVRFFRRITSITVQLQDEQLKHIIELNDPYDLPLVHVFIPPVSPEMRALSGCETPQKSQSYACQVALAESRLGFGLKELPERPKDWEFQSVSFDRNSQYAVTSYILDIRHIAGVSYSSLSLIQGAGKFPDLYGSNPWDAVPAEQVQAISIGAYQGEYVRGGFALQPGRTTLTWFEKDRQRLAWSEGARWYMIDFRPNRNVAGTMGKAQLIDLAESLVAFPTASTEPLDPAHLTSVSDAEQVSGLDLKAPTLLPMNINFSYAGYSSSSQQVRLVYGENEELTIQAWKGEFQKPLGRYENVHVNGEVAYFDPAEGAESRLFLWWHKDGLNYRMNYDQSLGWHIDREKMISIAESMQDVDDFQKSPGANYEEISLYEQALGMKIKKFPEAPPGWVFANFSSNVYARCIDMTYLAETGQGALSIEECRTDKRFGPSMPPSRSIEHVRVHDIQGQYAAGGFSMADNGKQVWDSSLHRKQLYWKEGGLWIQLAIYGDVSLLSDREDLILYAESLK